MRMDLHRTTTVSQRYDTGAREGMIETSRLVFPSYKRSPGTDGHISKKAKTIKDVCQPDENVVVNGGPLAATTAYPTLFVFAEQDIGEEHVVEVCSELDHVQDVVNEVDVRSSEDTHLSNAAGGPGASKLAASSSSTSSSDTRSSSSVNSVSGLRRDQQIDKALQQKRKSVYLDIHRSNAADNGMKDTMWNEDEYKLENIEYLLHRERNRLQLSGHSVYVEHRGKILAWLLNAAKTLKLSIEVIQLAVYFYDRFVDHADRLFLGDKLEVQLLTCLQLAAKSIEWDHHIPRGSDLNALLVSPYALSEYVRAEKQMLLFFQWNVNVPVLSTFLGYFREYLFENVKLARTRKCLQDIAEYFEKATLYHIVLQSLPCSQLALAVIVACRTLLDVQPFLSPSLRAILPHEEHQHMHWAGFLISLLERDRNFEGFKLRAQYGLLPQKPSLTRCPASRTLPHTATTTTTNLKPRPNCSQPLHQVHPLARCYLPASQPPNTHVFCASTSLPLYRSVRSRKKTATVISHDTSSRPYNSSMAPLRNYRRDRQPTSTTVLVPAAVSSLNARTVQGRF